MNNIKIKLNECVQQFLKEDQKNGYFKTRLVVLGAGTSVISLFSFAVHPVLGVFTCGVGAYLLFKDLSDRTVSANVDTPSKTNTEVLKPTKELNSTKVEEPRSVDTSLTTNIEDPKPSKELKSTKVEKSSTEAEPDYKALFDSYISQDCDEKVSSKLLSTVLIPKLVTEIMNADPKNYLIFNLICSDISASVENIHICRIFMNATIVVLEKIAKNGTEVKKSKALTLAIKKLHEFSINGLLINQKGYQIVLNESVTENKPETTLRARFHKAVVSLKLCHLSDCMKLISELKSKIETVR